MDQTTYDLLESAVRTQLKQVEKLNLESKEGKEALTKATALTELLITVDKDGYDYHDKEERRRIEEKKNDATAEVEREKAKLTWGRVGLELGKVIAPILVSFAGYNVFQKRVLKFEETGRIVSTAGRELHLPKFFK